VYQNKINLKRKESFPGLYYIIRGKRWRSLLWHRATSRKIAGSIPCGVTDFILLTLESTQPVTEMSNSDIVWGVKVVGA
jgi:hypothetical protein